MEIRNVSKKQQRDQIVEKSRRPQWVFNKASKYRTRRRVYNIIIYILRQKEATKRNSLVRRYIICLSN